MCALCIGLCVLSVFFFASCSNRKNTALTRFYHSVNTRYNIYFNANEAYKESIKARSLNQEDNLSQMLYVFPDNSDSVAMQTPGGDFTTVIDKTTKAIKLHSIKAKPRRDPKRRNDEKYQAWLGQKEYTPFMDKVWLLLAKAEFYEANYLQAITAFMHISRIYGTNPGIVAECQLWTSRAYTEMGWMYEAGNILHQMEIAGGAPDSRKALYSAVKANYLIRNREYTEAIPHLEYAIKKEKDKHQKLRLKYLLGQLYLETGDKAAAGKAFAAVYGMNTPYKFTFNAKLQELQLDTSKKTADVIASLAGMAKSSKNEEYKDRIYTTIGNIYLQRQDTAKAIESYKTAIKESVRNGYDKAMAQVSLGDIYFHRRDFIPAQPCYSEALPQLKKSDTNYPRVSFRSGILDELVVHAKVVHEQDSLQYLAGLPEEQRLEIIRKKVEELRKEEERRLKEEDRQKRQEQEEQGNRITSWDQLETGAFYDPSKKQASRTGSFEQQGSDAQFYFYNEQTVAQGKIAFQKQWGNRKQEDDWRRRSKPGTSSLDRLDDAGQSTAVSADKVDLQSGSVPNQEEKSIVEDMYYVDYYLQQLPFTEEAIKDSNVLIENALFNMGKIYKDKLEDMSPAIEMFNTDIRRFPDTPNLEEIYYLLLLIYMQAGNQDMQAFYRNKLLTEFPRGQYAVPLSEPDFEWNFRHMPLLQDSLYNSAYDAYRRADVQTVRNSYQAMKTKYPFTDMMPKFAFLNALSYAQTRDAKTLEDNLAGLVEKYPKADVTPLAAEILKRIKEGGIILSDGTPVTDFDWSKAYPGDNTTADENGKVPAYSDSLNTEYLLLLMYKSNTINRNELLYQVADYNFSNYVIQTFDLNFETDPPYDILQIKGFGSFAGIRSYINRAFDKEGLMRRIDTSVLVLPVSVDNYTKMSPRLVQGLERYMIFFAEHYGTQLPRLIAHWNKKGGIDNPKEQPDTDEPDAVLPEPADDTEHPQTGITFLPAEVKKNDAAVTQPAKPAKEKQINVDDLLTKEQQEKAGKINDAMESVEDIINNPVDGIKNLFNKYKNREKPTKEEKAEQKERQRSEKQRQKELKAMEKAGQDSINRVEKAIQDSIKAEEKQKQRQLQLEHQQKKEAERTAVKAKEDERKQKENERKEKEKVRKAERKEKERLQKERLRQREKERKEKEKQAGEKRKKQEKTEKNR
ncbi:MAG: tetratricopeptide repeat protein [Prevotella sp.]|jgi:tetratricopeptide (TPR) repeat protein|nr:tetratricopeptide repeat protein [Prevotella sp.]